MEYKNNTINSEECHKDNETKIKEKQVHQDEISAESEKHQLVQNETYFEECAWRSDVDTKIGIKEEIWDQNVVSADIDSDPVNFSTLDLFPFMAIGTMKGGDEMVIKNEHFNLEETTQSHKHNSLQNGTYFVECDQSSDMDTKIGTKQDTWYPNVISSDIKSDPENPSTLTGTIKGEDESALLEEPWWCGRTLTDSHNEEKESNVRKNETSKETLPLETPRLPTEFIYLDDKSVTFLDVKQDGAFPETVCRKNASHGTSIKQNISPLNCNQTCDSDDFESNQNQGDESIPVYKCEICEKCYTRKSNLNIHKMLHSGTTPYKCGICEKCFIDKSSLKRHILVHSGTKPHKCDMCDKFFTQKSTLQRHRLVHTGTKPYKCDICEKCFIKKSNLQSHTLVHSGAKPYKCAMCEKCFTCTSNLKRHTLVHSGTKPYKCDQCGKCFLRNSVLQKHKVAHSGPNS